MFEDLYSWAGTLRTIDISKGDTRFCNVNFLEREADKVFSSLASQNYFEGLDRKCLIQSVSELYGDMNMLHPFREGNGRVQRILFEHIIANCGYTVSSANIENSNWIEANIAAVVCDCSKLETIFEEAIMIFEE